jgi:DNA polymerase-3 subunit delta
VRNSATPEIFELIKNYDVASIKDITVLALQDTKSSFCDKKVLGKLLKLASISESFEPLTGSSMAKWIQNKCYDIGASIEPLAVTELTRLGKDSFSLANELEKLAAHSHGAAITLADVKTLVLPSFEYDEWELSNALASLDKRKAIATLWRRLHEGMPEQMAIGSIAAGLRTLLIVKDLLDRQIPATAIAKTAGLHPFVVSKNAHGARAADSKKLLAAHLSLAHLDRNAKNGRADATDCMFATLLSL